MQTIKYFIYARKSQESEDKQITSIKDQISETKKVAQELNLEIIDIISESKSAKEPGRKEFNNMIKRIQKGEANGILCWKLNRLARNPVDGGQISMLLQQGVIQHVQTYSRGYFPTDNVLMMQLEFGMANQFINDLRVDVKRGMTKKAERGWYPSPHLTAGYIHNTNRIMTKSKQEIITDKKTFTLVKRLWKLLLTGEYTIADLKRVGDKIGLKNRKGNPIALSSYYRLFSNEFYYGYFYWNDSDGNRVRFKGAHKPMITLKEFNKAQTMFNKKRISPTLHKNKHEYIALFRCGECDCAFTAQTTNRAYCLKCKCKFSIKNKEHCPKCETSIAFKSQFTFLNKTYYRCTKKRNKCSQRYLDQNAITTQINEVIESIHVNDEFYKWAIEALKHINLSTPDNTLKKQLQKQISKSKKRIKNYSDMRADKEINAIEFRELKDEIQNQIMSVEKQLFDIEDTFIDWDLEAKKMLCFASTIKKQYKDSSQKVKRNIIRQFGSNPKIKNKNLYFTTPKLLLALKRSEAVFIEEKGRLEPNKSLVKSDSFGDDNPPFSILCAELKNARTNHKIVNLNCQYNNNDYQNAA